MLETITNVLNRLFYLILQLSSYSVIPFHRFLTLSCISDDTRICDGAYCVTLFVMDFPRNASTAKSSVPLCSYLNFHFLNSLQFSSVAQSCPALCDPMNHRTPGLPVHHQLPEFTQTHVHRVSDANQPSHPLLSPSPPAPNPSQHQSLFQ